MDRFEQFETWMSEIMKDKGAVHISDSSWLHLFREMASLTNMMIKQNMCTADRDSLFITTIYEDESDITVARMATRKYQAMFKLWVKHVPHVVEHNDDKFEISALKITYEELKKLVHAPMTVDAQSYIDSSSIVPFGSYAPVWTGFLNETHVTWWGSHSSYLIGKHYKNTIDLHGHKCISLVNDKIKLFSVPEGTHSIDSEFTLQYNIGTTEWFEKRCLSECMIVPFLCIRNTDDALWISGS
jgi:hypothetical protein